MPALYSVDKEDRGGYPLGAVMVEGGVHVSFVYEGEKCALLLYGRGSRRLKARIPFPEELRQGDVWSMTVRGDVSGLEYSFEGDGVEMEDPCGRAFTGKEQWGREVKGGCLHTPFAWEEEFSWEGDRAPAIPYEDCLIYKIHVRGFTKHTSSGVSQEERGTFRAVEAKIPYLKELGVTTVELMPVTEFEECPAEPDTPAEQGERRGQMNYWGYGPGHLFAPKAAYASGKEKQAAMELKHLIRELHRAGMEAVIELYFTGQEPPALALEAARFWAKEYHVDGIHLVGFAPLELLVKDPWLSRLKLWADNWNGLEEGETRGKRLAQYRSGFQEDMRSFLKGDEGQLNAAAFHIRSNPGKLAAINYMANTNGFTMMDMVSYDQKHNEDNGEDNRDGSDFNQSWNCGAEGPVRKKRVLKLRRKQLRNAMLMLFLSQGTPLLQAGDEFGCTKKGNNNSYCQDNEISWVNWNLQKTNEWLYEFTKRAAAFRKEHGVFHLPKEPRLMDYRSLGLPDLSYHGQKAWCPDFDSLRRELGAFYCGAYGKNSQGNEDSYFYTAYNMHWEPREFALPHLPKGLEWHLVFDTDQDERNGFYPEGEEPRAEDQRTVMLMGRSIQVLVGKKADLSGHGSQAASDEEED